MTDRRFRSLCKWASVIASEFGLGDWHITIHESHPGESNTGSTAIASVSTVYGRKLAEVTIHPNFFHTDPEEQRHVILHEFLHIHLRQTRELIRSSLPAAIGQFAFDQFFEGYTLLDEHATDALATAIERYFPLWEGK